MTTKRDEEGDYIDFEEPLVEATGAVALRIEALGRRKATSSTDIETQAHAVKELAEALDILMRLVSDMEETDEDEEM